MRIVVAVLSVVLAAATGCTVQGNSVPQYPDPGQLDTGHYDTDQLVAPGGNEARGRVVESARMVEALMDPGEVVPPMVFPAKSFAVHLLPTPALARVLLADAVRPVLEREGMIAGCSVGKTDTRSGVEIGKSRALTVILLRFPDSAAAERAARDIDAVDASVSAENVAVQIPDHPGAHAHWRPDVPTLAATMAVDAYVVSVLAAHTSPDLGVLTAMARNVFQGQALWLRGFSPTPADRLAALPLDAAGMIGRLVPESPGRWSYPAVVVAGTAGTAGWDGGRLAAVGVALGRRGAAFFLGYGLQHRQVEALAVNPRNVLVRYSNVTAARAAWTEFKSFVETDESLRFVDGPAGAPDIYCTENTERTVEQYLCRVLYGRYVATIQMSDAAAIRQRAAAQYGLLLNGG
ncbi:DUF7373 family lipoprotein [Nocardia crassostreae]|uniref:DUF7373 family lipoprotein n=1 Tax=Nocardia crassostreae TaxID=53428 RepID=UPI000832A911|nr:hypothetical protein [Nocardia crassostreae]